MKINLAHLSEECLEVYTWGFMKTIHPEKISDNFLKYSKLEISENTDERRLNNSLNNAKKALHSRVEDIYVGVTGNLKLPNFPKMLETLELCGIIPAAIFKKINKIRNDAEHRYVTPNVEQVKDFIELTDILLRLTRRYLTRLVHDIEGIQEIQSSDGLIFITCIQFFWKSGTVSILYKRNKNERFCTDKIDYFYPSEEYFQCVKFAIENEW